MAKYLLDTNVVTSILKKRNPEDFQIIRKLQHILQTDAQILICPIVFYEVARDLYHKGAQKQAKALDVLVETSVWCEFASRTWDLGARLWADCRKKGAPKGDGLDKDVLIAAQVKEQNAILVTNNTRHFKNFDITYENWLEGLE